MASLTKKVLELITEEITVDWGSPERNDIITRGCNHQLTDKVEKEKFRALIAAQMESLSRVMNLYSAEGDNVKVHVTNIPMIDPTTGKTVCTTFNYAIATITEKVQEINYTKDFKDWLKKPQAEKEADVRPEYVFFREHCMENVLSKIDEPLIIEKIKAGELKSLEGVLFTLGEEREEKNVLSKKF